MSRDIRTITVVEGGMTYYKWVDGQLVKLEPEEVGPHFEKFLALPPEEQQKVLNSRPAITWSPEDLGRLKISLIDLATPEATARPKPPTGSGIIGQTGNKPGGPVAGSVLPPRPELIGDPRKRIEPDWGRQDSGAFAASGFVLIMLGAMAAGFILGRTL